MQSKSKSASQVEANPYNISPSAVCAEPWWRSTGYNYVPPAVIGGNTSNSSSLEQSKDGQSQSDGALDEDEDDAIRESQISASPRSNGNYGQGHQNFQHQTSAIPPRSNESLTQPPQLVGHSIVPPHLFDMHHARMLLPLEMAQEPVYVNAKQYHGILRRRQSRAKAELEKKLIKARKPYLHESRHQHAMRRARGTGGRFAKKSNNNTAEETGTISGSAISSHSASSSGSEPLHCEAAKTQNNHREAKGPKVHETYDGRGYQNHSSLRASTYGGHSAKGGEGDSSGQQWGSVSSNKASQRALAI
ncbi:hypothetical protein ACSBR1_022108 [Camellia fascicularis]